MNALYPEFTHRTNNLLVELDQIIKTGSSDITRKIEDSDYAPRANCVLSQQVLYIINAMKKLHSLYTVEYPKKNSLSGDYVNIMANHTSLIYNNPQYPTIHVEYKKMPNPLRTQENTLEYLWKNIRAHILLGGHNELFKSILVNAGIKSRIHPIGYPIHLNELERAYDIVPFNLNQKTFTYGVDKIIIYVDFNKIGETFIKSRVLGTLFEMKVDKTTSKPIHSISLDSSVNYDLDQRIDLNYIIY